MPGSSFRYERIYEKEGVLAERFYDVYHHDKKIGSVEAYYPTFERGSRRSRVVSKRWKSKRLYWRYILNGKTIRVMIASRDGAASNLLVQSQLA